MNASIGFIGTGQRASAYGVNLRRLEKLQPEFVALCDPNPGNLATFNRLYAGGKAALYSDYREMLARHPDLAGVVICTPNDTHEEIAVAAMRGGAHLILEKPLAHTPQACANILRASREFNRSVTLGFCLRYTTSCSKLRELVRSGVCGRITSVTADERVSPGVTRLMMGTWRRTEARSGGSLLEKDCHGLDIINWIMGRLPVRVSSFGGRLVFGKREGAGPRCRECRFADTCAYWFDAGNAQAMAAKNAEWRNMITWDDACLFDGGADLCDNQAVIMEYDDGAVLNYGITFNADHCGRHYRFIGTDGRVEGVAGGEQLEVARLRPHHHELVPVVADGGGHGGGDREVCRAFERALTEPGYQPLATVQAGFASAMVAFAADRSRRERRPVELAELYGEVGIIAEEMPASFFRDEESKPVV
jgi:predicted dehydrogenase